MEEQAQYPEIHYGSLEWLKIKNWLLLELKDIHEALAHDNTPWERTLYLRGRASLIKTMLNFEELAAEKPFLPQ